MTRALIVHRIGPGATVQDLGRPGYLAFGLSRGGAADRSALTEGAALLRQKTGHAALELVGMGGEFEATEDMRIALTGAPMTASIDGARVAWNASHLLPKGARLQIASAQTGNYGYLHVGGGITAPQQLGAVSTHLAGGLGGPIKPGDRFAVGADEHGETGLKLTPQNRFGGGTARVVSSLQTEFFAAAELERFEATCFLRDTRGNRMGVRLISDDEGFKSDAGLSILSEVIVPGDIQITGDGTPFVLLSECQTTGGYPRIGSVIPADLPRVVQARPGESLRFSFVSLEEAVAIQRQSLKVEQTLQTKLKPLIRDPGTMTDLLSYQLISGVTAGRELDDQRT